MEALVDADIVAFRIACTNEDVNSEDVILEAINDYITFNIIDPLEDCLEEKVSTRCFLTIGRNFRYDIYPEYKALRKDKPRPRHLELCKQLIIDHWAGEYDNRWEADDLMGMNQHEESVICTIDKDLDMVPGNHFNFVKNIIYHTSEEESFYWFCQQLLMGDKGTDNIPGVPLVNAKGEISTTQCFGPANAKRILEADSGNPEKLLHIVSETYRKVYGDHWERELNLRGQLLWINRRIPTSPNGYWEYGSWQTFL